MKLFERVKSVLKIRKKYKCPVCGENLYSFDPFSKYYLCKLRKYGFIYDVKKFETLNINSSTCPNCKVGDANRLYAIFFKKILKKITRKKIKFIDFAPVPELSKLIKSYKNIVYRSADLYMEGVDDCVDISNMSIYKDSSVDIFLCSHILEHVEDDNKALSELYRILKPTGWGIIMVPIMLSLEQTMEDKNINTEPERWKYYAQGDHLRMYSKKDFLGRLTKAGFKIDQLGINYFGKKNFEKYGITQQSKLYVVSK